MSRARISFAVCGLLLMLSSSAFAVPIVFSGSLTSADGGILGTGAWVNDPLNPMTVSWTVSQQAPNQPYHFSYDVSVRVGGVSHMIIEVSPDVMIGEILNVTGDLEAYYLGTFGEGSGNPNLPEDLFALKFEDGGTMYHIEFDAWREPTWGDFYAKDGKAGSDVMNTAWNAGFTSPDWDPIDPPANGALYNHLLVPDSVVVPEPATMALLGIGLGGLVLRRKR